MQQTYYLGSIYAALKMERYNNRYSDTRFVNRDGHYYATVKSTLSQSDILN